MTGNPPPTSLAPSTDQREQIVQRLCTHFASNHLTMEELEQRIDHAYRAVSLAELESLVSGLPALTGAASVPSVGAPPYPSHAAPATPVDVPARDVLIAVMSGHNRRGHWLVPRHLKIFAIMGGVDLDLRDAVIAPGLTEIEIIAVMGGVNLVVPPDVRVECVGSAFMGAFDVHHPRDMPDYSMGERILRISGFALMGGVEAKVRFPKDVLAP